MSKNSKKIIIMSFTIMLTVGVVKNLRGQLGPYIIDDLELNYSRLGFLFSFLSIGSMLVYPIGGKLIEKFPLKRLLLFGIIYNITALLAIYFSTSYYFLLLAFLLVGSGLTLLSIIAINLVSITCRENRGKMINLLHLFYGVGGIVAPYFVSLTLKLNFSWAEVFLFSIALLLIVLWEFRAASLPELGAENSGKMAGSLELLRDKKVILFSLMIFLQVGVEVALVIWLAPFLKNVEARPEIVVSFYLSLFFISFTLGRFLASLVVEKIGYYNSLIGTTTAAALLIIVALLGGRNFSFLLSLSGLFLAVQVPTAQAAILDSFDQSGIKVVGFAQTAGMIGATVISNWLVGFVNDLFSIRAGFTMLLLILAGAVLITYKLKIMDQKDLEMGEGIEKHAKN